MKQSVWVANHYVTEISKRIRDYVGFFCFSFLFASIVHSSQPRPASPLTSVNAFI